VPVVAMFSSGASGKLGVSIRVDTSEVIAFVSRLLVESLNAP
jgi:hypothetical protein